MYVDDHREKIHMSSHFRFVVSIENFQAAFGFEFVFAESFNVFLSFFLMNLNLVQHVGCLCGSVRQDSFDFSDAKANVNMQSNKVTLDDTVSVTIRHFSGLSLLLIV